MVVGGPSVREQEGGKGLQPAGPTSIKVDQKDRDKVASELSNLYIEDKPLLSNPKNPFPIFLIPLTYKGQRTTYWELLDDDKELFLRFVEGIYRAQGLSFNREKWEKLYDTIREVITKDPFLRRFFVVKRDGKEEVLTAAAILSLLSINHFNYIKTGKGDKALFNESFVDTSPEVIRKKLASITLSLAYTFWRWTGYAPYRGPLPLVIYSIAYYQARGEKAKSKMGGFVEMYRERGYSIDLLRSGKKLHLHGRVLAYTTERGSGYILHGFLCQAHVCRPFVAEVEVGRTGERKGNMTKLFYQYSLKGLKLFSTVEEMNQYLIKTVQGRQLRNPSSPELRLVGLIMGQILRGKVKGKVEPPESHTELIKVVEWERGGKEEGGGSPKKFTSFTIDVPAPPTSARDALRPLGDILNNPELLHNPNVDAAFLYATGASPAIAFLEKIGLGDVARELALSMKAAKKGNWEEARQHYKRAVALLEEREKRGEITKEDLAMLQRLVGEAIKTELELYSALKGATKGQPPPRQRDWGEEGVEEVSFPSLSVDEKERLLYLYLAFLVLRARYKGVDDKLESVIEELKEKLQEAGVEMPEVEGAFEMLEMEGFDPDAPQLQEWLGDLDEEERREFWSLVEELPPAERAAVPLIISLQQALGLPKEEVLNVLRVATGREAEVDKKLTTALAISLVVMASPSLPLESHPLSPTESGREVMDDGAFAEEVAPEDVLKEYLQGELGLPGAPKRPLGIPTPFLSKRGYDLLNFTYHLFGGKGDLPAVKAGNYYILTEEGWQALRERLKPFQPLFRAVRKLYISLSPEDRARWNRLVEFLEGFFRNLGRGAQPAGKGKG